MIVTEEEAKTKRCQESFGPPLSPDGASFFGSASVIVTSPTNCIGSACMAWRWGEAFTRSGDTIASKTKGYCGKAGKP